MKTYKLHLIRHGLTKGNLEGRYIGSTDLPLCTEGKTQLENLKDSFSYPEVTTCFTSPLLRARESAQILFPDASIYELDDLRELSFGEFEGKTVNELMTHPAYARWIDKNDDFIPEGCENGSVFAARTRAVILQMFEFMMKSNIPEAACVTHGGVIMSMLSQRALPERPANLWACDPGCGYTVISSTSLLMRDGFVEAVAITPEGYVGEEPPADYAILEDDATEETPVSDS
ncbi:MAG: histidine phosphatase family protein [Oscillospiraceae bacterium]